MRTHPLRAAVLALSLASACEAPSQSPPPAIASEASALLPVPADTVGNGPYALVVCQSNSVGGGDRDCNAGTAITDAATLNAALIPPAAAFETATATQFTFVHSWNLGYEVNFSNRSTGRGTGAFFATSTPASADVDTRTLFATTDRPIRLPLVVSGFVLIPPSGGADVVKTFGVGADDGAFLAIQGCATASPAANTCSSSATQLYTASDLTSGHALTYTGLKVVFPAAGGLFPFALSLYNNGGDGGFELAWAADDQLASLPNWTTVGTDRWLNPGSFTLVPKTSIHAPDVRAALVVSPLGTVVTAGMPLKYTATITNVGKTPAYPLATGGAGLSYTLAFPTTAFATGSITKVTVNNIDLTSGQYSVSTQGANTLVTTTFASLASVNGTLLTGSANAATVEVTATLGSLPASTAVRAQGLIKGQATDPVVITSQTVSPPQTLYVYTNDPSVSGVVDSGNAPDLLATIAGTPAALTANGGDDDDATTITVGSSTVAAPAITAFASNRSSSVAGITLAGTIGSGGTPPIAVTVAGVAQVDCASFGGGSNWSWDAANSICTCSVFAGSNAWTCEPIALHDCSGATLCYTATAMVRDNFVTGPSSAPYSFAAVSPGVTIASPTSSPALTTHAIGKPSGSSTLFADGTGSAPPTGTTVTVTVTGPNAFSQTCTATTAAATGNWTCGTNIVVTGDGTFTMSAVLTEATGDASTPAVGTFTADTKPTLTAPTGGLTNSVRPQFGGTKIGDGTKVRVCLKTAGQCASGSANSCSVNVAATKGIAWTCTPSADIISGTYVAYELDTAGTPKFSAPSDDFVLTINAAAATVTNVPANKTFNLANTPFTFNGACATGQTVTAAINTATGGAVSCTSPCTSSAWTCSIAMNANTDESGRTLAIDQKAPDNSSAPTGNTTGIIVDVKRPANISGLTATPAAVGLAGPNPPVITGAGETGSTVTLTATGTTRGTGHAVTATASGTSLTLSSSTLTCNPATPSACTWTVIDTVTPWPTPTLFPDGSYIVSATETDAHGNAQAGVAATTTFNVKTVTPTPTLNAIGNANGFIGSAGPNPPTVTGGSGESGDTLKVTVKDAALTTVGTCTATLVADASWTCNAWTGISGSVFATGTYTATAKQTDFAANVSGTSNTVTFTVDTTAPNKPTIDSPANNSFVTSAAFNVLVTPAEANGTLTITLKTFPGGVVVPTTCANLPVPAIGNLQQTCAFSGVANGAYVASALQTDRAGNSDAVNKTQTSAFLVDTTLAPTPVLGQPTSPTAIAAVVFSGTGFPGSTVTVKSSTFSANQTLCTVAVDTTKTNGAYAWTCTSGALEDLDYVVTATSNAAGATTSNTVTVQIRSLPLPTLTAPASTSETKPTFTIAVLAGAAGKTATVYDGTTAICSVAVTTAPGSIACAPANYAGAASLAVGNHSLTAVLADAAVPPHRSLPSAAVAVAVLPPSPQLTAAGTLGTNQPLLSGSGTSAGATVTIKSAADGSVVCTTTADADGAFQCQVGASPVGALLADGTASLAIEASLNGKTSAATAATVVIRATPAMVPPTTPTKNNTPQLCVAPAAGVPAGSTVHVVEAATTLCSAPAAATGGSCCTPATAIADGTHLLKATVTFPPGGTSAASDAVELRIKTSTAAPLFSGPTAGGVVSGPVTITGTAEAGATVTLTLDGADQPALTVGSDGTFSTAVGTLATGGHQATAMATDALGNTASSTALSFTVGLGGTVRGGCSSGTGPSDLGALPLLALLLLLWPRERALRKVKVSGSSGARRSSYVVPGRRRPALAACAAVAVSLVAPAAMAQSIGLDHFKPASGGDGLFGVEGARAPIQGEGALQLRVWGQGMSKPLVFLPDGGGERALISSRIGGWLSAQLHVAGPFSVAAQLPFLLSQSGDLTPLPSDVAGGGARLGGGLGDLRLTGRMSLLRQEHAPVDVSAQLSFDLPTAGQGKYLGDGALQGEALLAAGRRVELASSSIDLLGNFFVRLRPSRELLGIKEGSELGLRGGVAWLPESAHPAVPTRILAEVEGASFLRAGFAGGSVPAEWRAGVGYCVGRAFAFDLGLGGALSSGIGAPALRVVGGISFGSPTCGQALRAEPVRTRPRIVEALRPPKIETPPEALVAPPPLIVAEADLPTALDDGPTPASSAGEKRKPRKKVAAAAPPPMLDLPALPLLDAPPKAEPAAGDQPKSVASAELPALPSLDLPLLPLEPSKKEKKAKKVAMAPAIPDLPGLDLPLPAAAPSASKAARLATLGESRIETARPIAFQGNSARLANDGRKVLDDVARVLFTNPELRIEVAGHADSDANGGLAQARAAAVAAYLRAKGIDADRLAVESFGASQPLLAGVTKSARKKNLRVELNLLKR